MVEVMSPEPKGLRLLTHSRMTTFRDCAYKHAVTYEDAWRPLETAEVLHFGSLWHTGLEAWWTCVKIQDAAIESHEQALTRELPPEELRKAFDLAVAAVYAATKDPLLRLKLEELLRGYHVRWRYDAMLYEVLNVETAFVCPLINPATGRRSETWELAGKVDVIVKRRSDQRVGIVEHKTTGESIGDPAAPYWIKLALDPQLSIYVVGAESLGLSAEFVIYDVVKKPEIKLLQPTAPESRKYRKRKTVEEMTWAEDDARLLYKDQRVVEESLEEFRERFTVGVKEKLEDYFQRKEVARTESQLAQFLHDAWWTGRMIRELQLAGQIRPRNPSACHRMGTCWLWGHCAFGKPLVDAKDGGDYRKVGDVHPELEGAY